jgi:cytochrome c biogenesis protein ResB
MSRLINLLASLKLALSVLLVIAVACIIGTILPQGSAVLQYLEANPDAQAKMDLLGFLGLTNVFYCWWFVLLLCLLAVSLSICTFRRFRAALRRKSGLRWKDVGSLFTHVSMLLILSGCVVRAIWGINGYLPLREGETKNTFQVDAGFAKLPFDIHLEDFEIEFYGDDGEEDKAQGIASEKILVLDHGGNVVAEVSAEMGAEQFIGPVRVRVLKKIPDFVVSTETGEIVSRSDEMRNPALQLEVVAGGITTTQWLFALYPGFDMHGGDKKHQGHHFDFRYNIYAVAKEQPGVKDYKSTLAVFENGVEVRKKTIEVNLPLSYKGYTFYQSGFNPDDHKWTSLQVVKDPGVPLVYAGFLMMIIGLTMVFYISPDLSVDSSIKGNKS